MVPYRQPRSFTSRTRWYHIDNPEASLREQDGTISTTPKLHFENKMVPYRQPRSFTSRTRWYHIDNPEASLREQDGTISTTPKLHFENKMVPYQLPLDLRWAVRLPGNSYTCIFKFFTTRVLLFNEYEYIYGTTYEYIATYRHRLRSTR